MCNNCKLATVFDDSFWKPRNTMAFGHIDMELSHNSNKSSGDLMQLLKILGMPISQHKLDVYESYHNILRIECLILNIIESFVFNHR